jgi:hypothetical protein
MKDIYIHEMITGVKSLLCKTFLVRVINQRYIRNVKGILTEPTRRFLHTNVSSKNLSPATQLYSARLIRQKKRKDSKDMQGYLAYGLLQLQEALLKVHPYIKFLLAVISSSLTNHSR